ncbi:MAG: SOUL heme-binding protein [Methanocella sp. PtaU1.Bin125]|nr:MAG: SOUL heme-binding protein [Methanocella sp. PtaU1.Bin125]
MSTEQPAYETIKRDGDFEVRRYNGYIMAQVDVRSDFDDALRQGFMMLYEYISGHNRVRLKIPMTVPVTEEIVEDGEKIPMTTPVTAEKTGEGVYRISFVMPGRYTLDTLPRPDNENIRFREVGDHNVAVVRFSGHSHEPRVQEKMRQLVDWMQTNGLVPKSCCRLARYDPPWIPGFMRRNEVMADF